MVDAASLAARTPARYQLFYLVSFVSFAALIAFGFWAALIEAPAVRATAQERHDREILAENLGFCEKFGMHSGTSEFQACARELAIVRKRQVSRDHADELGLL
ncbi:hypothetical protein [Bradyrhizobium sp. CER78]|uniref:hypothetical protein n=1 Tax=Bradyrhizobium sp. CER78 TaxID=3039162 RepID=UPI00244C24F5|nr:hypothetical protein [Bradyrhizobium sp. CER78]MDH2386161.1 hypothetical protein [Bradyrhizobium sp. CER78]